MNEKQVWMVSGSDLQELKRSIVDDLSVVIETLLKKDVNRVVGREEMAELLGVGVATLDRLVRDAMIPSMMANSRRLFRPEAVFSALEQSTGENNNAKPAQRV